MNNGKAYDGPITDIVTQDKQSRWREARLGRFTASTMSDIICAKGKLTQTALSRIAAVAAERLTGMEAYSAQTKAMEWGQEMESQAFDFLSAHWLELDAATFIPFKEFAGATPDAYGNDGHGLFTVDLKCPFNSGNFVQWCSIGDTAEDLKAFSKDYYWQIMAQAMFAGTSRCALVYVDPRMKDGKGAFKARVYDLLPETCETIGAALVDAEQECQRMMALMQD